MDPRCCTRLCLYSGNYRNGSRYLDSPKERKLEHISCYHWSCNSLRSCSSGTTGSPPSLILQETRRTYSCQLYPYLARQSFDDSWSNQWRFGTVACRQWKSSWIHHLWTLCRLDLCWLFRLDCRYNWQGQESCRKGEP